MFIYCKDNVHLSGSQHPSSGLLKCITSASGTGHAAKHKGYRNDFSVLLGLLPSDIDGSRYTNIFT